MADSVRLRTRLGHTRLPIEQVLTKGIKRKELDRAEYLRMCRDYALTRRFATQRFQIFGRFRRLGKSLCHFAARI